jgi:hypothetical protein
MDKNWLIRTKSNHILGPVSKEKVVELYQNGSIKPDDEICSGNGFWFFIREDEMVEKYLMGTEVQGFNPISEAKDVLTVSSAQSRMSTAETEDITLINGVNLSILKQPNPQSPPDTESTKNPTDHKENPVTENKKKNDLAPKAKVIAKPAAKPLKKQNYLQYLGILGFLILFLIVYFRKSIIDYVFQGELTSLHLSLIDEVHAQEEVPGKKKSF